MSCYGMVSCRNETAWITDTLDSWGEVCDGGIWVYCDASTDATPALVRSHPAVRECIDSNLYWVDNRAEMEPYKRQLLFNSVTRFCELNDWVVGFDADEHLDLESWNPVVLHDLGVAAISPVSWDMYITEEDEGEEWVPGRGIQYLHRQWCSSDGPGVRCFPFFLRWDPRFQWTRPNQHFPDWDKARGIELVHGHVKHWSKGHSAEVYDRKARYYQSEWEKDPDKMLPGMEPKACAGEAVRRETPYVDDSGYPLVKWEDRHGLGGPSHRDGHRGQ